VAGCCEHDDVWKCLELLVLLCSMELVDWLLWLVGWLVGWLVTYLVCARLVRPPLGF
jgi:hypothetical protein